MVQVFSPVFIDLFLDPTLFFTPTLFRAFVTTCKNFLGFAYVLAQNYSPLCRKNAFGFLPECFGQKKGFFFFLL